MKKKLWNPIRGSGWQKIFLIMRITVFFFLAGLLHLSASVYSQQTNLQVKAENKSIIEVLKIIEAQSDFHFLYRSDNLKGILVEDIDFQDAKLEEILDKVLVPHGFTYEIDDRTIVIKKSRPDQKQNFQQQPQKKEISGTVKDVKGQSLPGATVQAKGTTIGTITDAEGKFVLNIPIDAKIISVSFIGMVTEEISLGNMTNLNVVLKEASIDVEEVVVVGYGSILKSQLGGGSIGTVKVSELQKAPVKSFEEALAGRVAGVQVTSAEGGPLSGTEILIRGQNSISNDNSPLWVVDGFPMESSNSGSIDMSNIKSITVLKDAASTAIYGSRGANGVILITTNEGKTGAPVVTFDGYYGIQENLNRMDLMKPYEYVRLQIDRAGPSGKSTFTPGDPTVGGSSFVPGGRTIDYYKTQKYNDWQDIMYRRAPMQNYSVSLSGGTDKSRYVLSGSMTDQQGIIIASSFKRYQGRFVFNQDIGRKTKFYLNVNYANAQTTGSAPSSYAGAASYNLLYSVWGYRPATTPNSSLEDQLNALVDPDGRTAYMVNPLLNTINTIRNASTNTLTVSTYLDYNIVKNLTLRVSGGLNYVQSLGNGYAGVNTSTGISATSLTGPSGSISNSKSRSLVNENTLNYQHVFNKDHSINALVGFSNEANSSNSFAAVASQVPNDALGTSGLDEGTPYSISSSSSKNYLFAYFGRVMYNYKQKYFLTGVVRADASSKFAPGNKWGYFPSASARWNVAKEDFMKDLSFVSEFNFRVSYGISGNNRVGDFPYLSPIRVGNVADIYPFENTWQIGAVQPGLGNKNLKWETTEAIDIGLDLGIIKNRVELTVDYYKKVTSDLLLAATMPGSSGYSTALKNIGSVSNVGWEFTLNTTNVTNKNFNWDSNFNISFNKNKILTLSSGQQALITQINFETNPTFPYIAQVGKPVSQFIGYKWIGNYQFTDFDQLPNGTFVLKGNVSGNGNARATIQPGDIRYEDINGDGIMNDQDKMVIGDPNPLFTGGFSNNFTYKGFDLNVLFSFSYGNDILNANRNLFEVAKELWQNQFATFENRWTPENQTDLYPRASTTAVTAAVASNIVEDGSFLRLKTIALGYTLPNNLLQKINVKSARVYCSAQNIAVWSNYKGSDPEVSTKGFGLTRGFDFSSYPRSFTLVFGFKFSF